MGTSNRTADQRRAARTEKVEAMQAQLADAVDALADSEQWQRWLDHIASFHHYSFRNTLLIFAQCPHATTVAGFRAWQKKGRQVRKGERGIKIFGRPFRVVTETDEVTGETTRTRIPCPPPVATVFDISQTDPIEGAEQPGEIAHPLQGEAPANLYNRIARHMAAQGWTVERQPVAGASHGYCTVDGTHRIVVDDTLSDAQATKTLIHEAAHALLHTDDDGQLTPEPDQPTREIEAESTAYVVAGLAGLDTSDYSVGYVGAWSRGDTDAIRNAAVRIQAAVHELAEALDPEDQTTE